MEGDAAMTDPVPTTYPVAIVTNGKLIADLRARGLIVLTEPDDDALDRAVDAWFESAKWPGLDDPDGVAPDFRDRMRAVLAALADGQPT
jgi:hypothetical protein